MINYLEGELTDILPSLLKDKPAVQALSYALNVGTRMLMGYADLCYVYCSIDTMPDEVLDLLAVELRTQYYSDTLDLETKRALVRNTLLWYMTAGTPAAVEELVTVVFGEGTVEEWYEYGGEPYWFRIITDTTLDENNVAYFSEMIRRVKNTRSHLGAIGVHRTVDCPYYAGAAVFPMYHPAAIRDGYDVNYEIDLTEYTGAAAESIYKPAAITEDLKYEAEPVNETTCAGAGAASIYKQSIKEE